MKYFYVLVIAGCARDLPPPCDAATYSAMLARCEADISLRCPAGLGPCKVRDDCKAEFKRRETTCLSR